MLHCSRNVFLGGLLILILAGGCSPSVPKLVPHLGPEKPVVDHSDLLTVGAAVDILFVVDNSGSMSGHQIDLATNINGFVANFNKIGSIDYHIGIITTDNDQGSPQCCGRLVGSPSVITPKTPNGLVTLSKNLLVGINGSFEEKMFDPVVAALSPPFVDGVNSGFLRKEAYLAIIFLSDAEDQSIIAVGDFYNFLMQLKGQKSSVLLYGVLVPTGADDNVCLRDDNLTPVRVESLLNMVVNAGNNELSLCDSDFGSKLASMGSDLASHLGRNIYLTRPPVLESIHVYFGSRELPNDFHTGWTFDPERNAIIIGDAVDWTGQPDGSTVKVTYDPAEYKP